MNADLIPIEELDKGIHNLCTRINVATCELLALIREFDERAGYYQWGLQNTAEWLAWRCDLSMTTAREKVRVAHALKILPAVSAVFATGELSYSKVKEMTRVANRQNEEDLVEFALRHTSTTVAERCRELRFGSPDSVDTSWSVRQVDAFVNMARGFLSGENEGSSDNHLVTIHVDQSALAGKEGRAALPIEAVKRLCCDGKAVVLTEDERGEPLNIGRKSRVIPKAIERALRARDKNCCSFPGCNNHRFLHSHHVEHWSNGGETALNNLMLLCTKHHTLVHEGGFRIEKDYRDNWFFARPDGIAVPEVGYNPPVGGLLSVVEKTLGEPPPPLYLH